MPDTIRTLAYRFAEGLALPPVLATPAAGGVTRYPCQQCGAARPAFALYDTRARGEFATDWSCESCVAVARRAATAVADLLKPVPVAVPTRDAVVLGLLDALVASGTLTAAAAALLKAKG